MQIQKIKYAYDFFHTFMKSSRINKIWNTNHIGEPQFDTEKLYFPSDYVEVCKGRHKDFMTCECVSSMGLRFPEFLF